MRKMGELCAKKCVRSVQISWIFGAQRAQKTRNASARTGAKREDNDFETRATSVRIRRRRSRKMGQLCAKNCVRILQNLRIFGPQRAQKTRKPTARTACDRRKTRRKLFCNARNVSPRSAKKIWQNARAPRQNLRAQLAEFVDFRSAARTKNTQRERVNERETRRIMI